MRITISLFLLFSLLCDPALGQDKLSLRLKANHSRSDQKPQSFSISVKNSFVFISRYHAQVTILRHHQPSHTFVVQTTRQWVLENLQSDENILFVDLSLKPRTESANESANPSVNRVNMVVQSFPEVNGEEQHISIKEQQFDSDDIDLIGRGFTTVVSPQEISTHATSMATFIGGAGNSSEKGRGISPGARMTSSGFRDLLPDDENIFMDHHIDLQNHSYGTVIENYYGNEAAAYDRQSYDLPTLLHVFSAGNIGTTVPPDGKYTGFKYANLSGNFKQAKNVLVVSALNESLQVPDINSRGPAFDGRIKPELVAYGAGGTSDAAAMVTGISSLIQQRYLVEIGVQAPSASVKAILIASADDVGQKGLDHISGYGNVNAYKALQLVDRGQMKEVSLQRNEVVTLPIDVPAGMHVLKIAVVWTDPPASVNASNVLIHNINAHLDVGGAIIHPWKLRTSAHADSLVASAYRGTDTLNNVEYITVDDPPAGVHELTIEAPELTTPLQSVSVAYWWETDAFSWNYPVATDVLEADITTPIFWNPSASGTGSVWYRLNDGEWTLNHDNVPLEQAYRWEVPDTLAKAQLKMVINDVDYVSEPFLISPRPHMQVLYNCTDEFALSWKEVAGAEGYQLFSLVESSLLADEIVADTVTVRSKTPARYFSVAPVLGSRTGLRSIAMDYAVQGPGCYINLFTAQRLDVHQVILQLQLSTLMNVAEVIVYRLQGSSPEELFHASPTTMNIISYDKALIESDTMRYMAEVVLTTGEHILSDEASVYIPERNTASVYPNPLPPGIDLTVVSDGTGQLFRVVDGTGKSIYETTLNYMEESITLDQLVPGLYFFQLISAEGMVDAGKFVKQ